VRGPGGDGIGNIDLIFDEPQGSSPESLKGKIEQELEHIEFFVNQQRTEIDNAQAGLAEVARNAIRARRTRLQQNVGLTEFLGIPLKKKNGAPTFAPIEVQRNIVRPLPPPPASGYKPEPGVPSEIYEHILEIIRHEGRTFEATPKTYSVHDEEELRDILLAHLNGHYKGDATAEAFRKSGKTDIRIEQDNRAAFVAECKIWQGVASLTDACDQLTGYLTWRDCKAALVVFNKNNARFSELQTKLPTALREHPRFLREQPVNESGEWRFVFCAEDDEAREITVHVFLFNLYIRPHKKNRT
jgi:hypothetical protein